MVRTVEPVFLPVPHGPSSLLRPHALPMGPNGPWDSYPGLLLLSLFSNYRSRCRPFQKAMSQVGSMTAAMARMTSVHLDVAPQGTLCLWHGKAPFGYVAPRHPSAALFTVSYVL